MMPPQFKTPGSVTAQQANYFSISIPTQIDFRF